MAINCIPIFKSLTTANIKIAGPLLALFVGFQVLTDIKFSCPCSFGWNQLISLFIIFAPTFLALVTMLLFLELRAQGKKTSLTQDKSGTSQAQDESGTSQSKETKQEQKTRVIVSVVPSVVWLCLCLIDGDYIACAATDWNGKFACDNELHPNCLSWCKPELNQGRNETELYNRTHKAINISKVLGYFLASLFCILAILCLKYDCSKCSNCCRGQDNPTIGGNDTTTQQDLQVGDVDTQQALQLEEIETQPVLQQVGEKREAQQEDPANPGTMTDSEESKSLLNK